MAYTVISNRTPLRAPGRPKYGWWLFREFVFSQGKKSMPNMEKTTGWIISPIFPQPHEQCAPRNTNTNSQTWPRQGTTMMTPDPPQLRPSPLSYVLVTPVRFDTPFSSTKKLFASTLPFESICLNTSAEFLLRSVPIPRRQTLLAPCLPQHRTCAPTVFARVGRVLQRLRPRRVLQDSTCPPLSDPPSGATTGRRNCSVTIRPNRNPGPSHLHRMLDLLQTIIDTRTSPGSHVRTALPTTHVRSVVP